MTKILPFALLVIAFSFSVSSTQAAKPAFGKQPNVILVITDDQGYAPVGRHGHPWIHTPHLDQMHDKSTRFTRFLVSPTCSPTRAALMSGRHPLKNGITHTILERERMALKTTTLPQVLATAGYASGIFGKWHLGDEEPYQPHKRGFGEAFIHGAGGIGQAYKCSCADAPGNKYFNPTIRHNGSFVKTNGYCTDLFFTAALGSFIFQSTTFALPKIFDERLAGFASSGKEVGWWAFAVFAVASFAQLVVGYMVDRHSVRRVFAAVAGGQAVMFAVMFNLTGMPALIVGVACMLVVFGQIPINDVLIGRIAKSEWRSRAYSARYVISFAVMATTVPAISALHGNWGFHVLFVVMAVLAALIFFAVLFLPGTKLKLK